MLCLLLCMVLVVLFSASGYAAEPAAASPGYLPLGPLRVKPSITIDQRFTDNLFQENAGEKSDAVTTITPRIVLQLPYGRNF
ncbi:hypothetical protein ACFL0Q_09335, partial [Thermodesulfobacteriota bacterium]